jgi:hypothetical protein
MSMDRQVPAVCRSAFAQLRNIGLIRQYLTSDDTKSLVNGLVTSRLDYCNALLCAPEPDAQTPTGAELCSSHCDETIKV